MSDKKKIIEKIQKLLAKKDSNFSAEAENAILIAESPRFQSWDEGGFVVFPPVLKPL